MFRFSDPRVMQQMQGLSPQGGGLNPMGNDQLNWSLQNAARNGMKVNTGYENMRSPYDITPATGLNARDMFRTGGRGQGMSAKQGHYDAILAGLNPPDWSR